MSDLDSRRGIGKVLGHGYTALAENTVSRNGISRTVINGTAQVGYSATLPDLPYLDLGIVNYLTSLL